MRRCEKSANNNYARLLAAAASPGSRGMRAAGAPIFTTSDAVEGKSKSMLPQALGAAVDSSIHDRGTEPHTSTIQERRCHRNGDARAWR